MVKKILAKSYVYLILLLMYVPIIVLIIFSFTNSDNVGTWNGFTFSKDAWDYDQDGNRALVIKAGSYLKIPTLKPLRTTTDQSTTFEIM